MKGRICISRGQQKMLLAAFGVAMIGILAAQAPDAKRYMKFESM